MHSKDLAQQARQLAPLGIGAAAAHVQGEALQPLEGVDLRPELGDGLCRGRLVEDGFLRRQHLVLRGVVQVLDVVEVEAGRRRMPGRVAAAALQDLHFAQLAFQALAPPPQRLVDGLRRRRQAALQDGQREADGAGAAVVLQRFGAVELLAHVIGDRLVEAGLGRRQLVGNGVGDALREQRRAVEGEQLLLHHAAHQVGHVDRVRAVAEAALEAVAVQERHEELEVRFLAVVRRRRHQEEVARQAGEELAEAVAPGVPDLAAEERGRHLVGLVTDDQVPAGLGRLQLVLHVFVARQLVQARDDELGLQEPVAGARGFQVVVGENLERQVEAPVELVLPLLRQAAGADDQAALQVAAGDQLLDEQPRHDGLAGPRIVGQQEAQRLPGQHGFVHRGDLVRQRLDLGGVHRENGIEEMRQADALRLGDQPEQGAVAVEAPRPAGFGDFEPLLVVAVQQLVGDLAGGRLVGQLQRLGAEPLHADHRNDAVRQDAAQRGVGLQVFELHDAALLFRSIKSFITPRVENGIPLGIRSPASGGRTFEGRMPSLQEMRLQASLVLPSSTSSPNHAHLTRS